MNVLRRLTHVSLSVSDLDASIAFYHGTLGLPVLVDRFAGIAFDGEEIMLLVGGMALCLQAHHATAGGPFDPRRPGLDHLALAVDTPEDLHAWSERLGEPIKELPGYGRMIELRDPDGILVELHCLSA
jgi:catechol 2,3-dioxygenase-like lactoylglutathione lyase family enzyme